MLNLIRQYLRHSRIFRMLLFPIFWLRKRLFGFRKKGLVEYYESVVRGGRVIISPVNFPGQYEISATSDLAKRVISTGTFEPELTTLLGRLTGLNGDIAVIGANVGFYAVFFAKLFPNVRKVIAIEPNPEAFGLLQSNIWINDVGDRIDALQICVGEIRGQVEFAFIPGKSEYSSMGEIAHSAVRSHEQQREIVDVLPLSEVNLGRNFAPGLIFVDTEGAELLVLKGAEDVIKESRPILFFECEDALLQNFNHSSQMLDDYVVSLGYIVRNASAPRLKLAHPFTGVAVAIPEHKKNWLNILYGKSPE